jgi:hypothetical protein
LWKDLNMQMRGQCGTTAMNRCRVDLYYSYYQRWDWKPSRGGLRSRNVCTEVSKRDFACYLFFLLFLCLHFLSQKSFNYKTVVLLVKAFRGVLILNTMISADMMHDLRFPVMAKEPRQLHSVCNLETMYPRHIKSNRNPTSRNRNAICKAQSYQVIAQSNIERSYDARVSWAETAS